jgi:DNA-binding transcriptional ArsR family regulator
MAARPATRRPASSAPAQSASAPKAPVRDFGASSAFTVEWDVRPVYDFLFSLSADAGTTDDLPAADREWLTTTRAALSDPESHGLQALIASDLAIHIASYAIQHPELRTGDDLVASIDTVETAAFLRALLTDFLDDRITGDLIDRCAHGDEEALSALRDAMPEHKTAFHTLLDDPSAAHRHIAGALRAWADAFRPIEARITGILERDHAGRVADRATLDPSELIERTTNGIRWLPEVAVKRVILAPSYFSRPYNFLLAGEGWRFFGYPVSDDALEADDRLAPPLGVVRLHRALGDETRLRILKLLSARDLYLTEIAQQLELSKPTIKHHLAILRSAGLVTIVEAGSVIYYSLRRGRVDDASSELAAFLTP